MSIGDIQKINGNFGCEFNMNPDNFEHGHCCRNVHLPLLTGN